MTLKGHLVAQSLGMCLGLESPSQGPGIQPRVGLPALPGTYFSLSDSPCLCSLSHSLSFSLK